MRKQITLGILILMMSISSAFCDRPVISLHVGADGQYPVNGFIPGNGFGGLGYLDIGGLYSGIAFTVSLGYIYHLKEDDIKTFNEIPILGGFKFNPDQSPVYVVGELGDVIEQISTSGTGTGASSTGNFGWDIGTGWEAGPLDLRFTYNDVQVKNTRDAMSISLNIIFSIWDNM